MFQVAGDWWWQVVLAFDIQPCATAMQTLLMAQGSVPSLCQLGSA